MSITGYATSRSPLTAWTQLLAQKLTRTAQGVLSAYCVTNLLYNVNDITAHIGLMSPSDITPTLDSARLGVSRAL